MFGSLHIKKKDSLIEKKASSDNNNEVNI